MAELLTQTRLAKKISEECGITEDTAKTILERFFGSLKNELKATENVSITGLGVFKKNWIEESDGINPSTGQTIRIPAHYRIKFKAAAPVAELFNKKYSKLKPKLIKEKPVKAESEAKEEPEAEEKSEDTASAAQEKKNGNGRIIAVIVIALIVLVILIALLARGCASKKEPAKALAPVEQSVTKKEQSMTKDEQSAEPATTAQKTETVSPIVTKTVSEFSLNDYKVNYGGNYHTIAVEQYNNRHLWPVIYNANKGTSPDPDVIVSGAIIKVPEIKSLSEDAENIKAAMLQAYNAYKDRISSANSDYEKSEKKRLAAGVLTSAEVLYPGFIDANKDKIDSEYAQYAKEILERNYPER